MTWFEEFEIELPVDFIWIQDARVHRQDHFYVDNVWKVLEHQAGCLAYQLGVLIQHVHPGWGSAPQGNTCVEVGRKQLHPDGDAFHHWLAVGAAESNVRAVRSPRSAL